VDDTVNGFIKAAIAPDAEGKTFNLGTGTEIKIGELVQKIIEKAGKSVKIEIDSQRLRPQISEVFRLLSNNALARERLGWQPEIDFERGLDLTIAWIREHLDLYRLGTYEF
jgi:dTDP-glucose 4,6-dehydratase